MSAPSPGYTLLQGDLANPPRIAPEDRAVLWSAARSLNLYVESVQGDAEQAKSNGRRPGDAYNERGDPLPLLEAAGWSVAYKRADGAIGLCRPGKTKQQGIGATFGYVAPRTLYVFTTGGDPFNAGHAYAPFAIYTLLQHGGDYTAAAKALAAVGYGDALVHVKSNEEPSVQEPPAWMAPLSLDTPRLPTFPTDVFPTWLQTYIEAEAVATETPPDLAAMLAIAVLATACATKFRVRVKEGWTEPTNIFTVTALPPGSRKSGVFRDMIAPLVAYEREEMQRVKPLISEAQLEFKVLSGRREKAEKAAINAPDDDMRTQNQDEALHIARELDALTVPVTPRLIADDVTPEKLASMLAEHNGHIAVLSAEATVFDLMAGRYSKGTPNFDVFLKGHAGDELRVDRGSRSDYVAHPALTLGITVQPSVIQGLTEKPSFQGRGLLGRFLYALPASGLGRRTHATPPVAPAIHTTYERNITALLHLPYSSDEYGEATAHMLRFDAQAYAALQTFQQQIEPHLDDAGDLGHMTDWASKLAGALARIAALLHVAAG
ncbi:MAG: hypothetical protein CYG59_14710, partial [Chloroflexi bacterium]